MTSTSPTIAHALATRVFSPFAVSLGLGVAASSYFFFANVGSHYFGGPALITSTTLTAGRERKQRVEVFAWFYERAAPHMAGSAAFGALAYWLSAYTAPNPSVGRPSIRPLLIVAGGLSAFMLPWTVITMMSINKQLINIRNADRKASKPETEADAQHVGALIQRWRELHYVRVAVAAASWVTGISALTLAF